MHWVQWKQTGMSGLNSELGGLESENVSLEILFKNFSCEFGS